MRIALVGPVYPYRGGIAHYTSLLCQALKAQGHEVLLVSFKRQYPALLYPGRSDKDPGQSALDKEDARYWIDSLNPLSWLLTFWRIMKFGPDRLIFQWWTIFWAPLWLTFTLLNGLVLRKPIVFICHNVRPHDSKDRFRFLSRLIFRFSDACIVHSDEEKRHLKNLVPGARVAVCHLPVFKLFYNNQLSKASARALLKLPPHAPVFLFFGIVRPYKGLKDLVAAFPSIRRELEDALLIIAGEFWESRLEYEQLIERLALGSAIRVDDRYIPDIELQRYLSATDIVIVPYRSVTGSAVVQTARGYGVPVVATRLGSLEELASADDYITLVDVGDEASLVRAILALYHRSRSESSSRCIPERDGWPAIVEVIEGSLESVEALVASEIRASES
jgi:glycosyltransferase involved in cell wall biosynthesis